MIPGLEAAAIRAYEKCVEIEGNGDEDVWPPWEKLTKEEQSVWRRIACAVLFEHHPCEGAEVE